ncbi:MAG: class I SAM-dependent RNA methyltransferase [Acidobacteriota bacterium]
MKFIATAPILAEGIVEDELLELGAEKTSAKRGKIYFESSLRKACEIGFNLRSGKRILMPLSEFRYSSKESFYEVAKEIEWEKYIPPSMTFSVRIKGGDSVFKNTAYAALVLKDAIVDRIRDKKGARPSIDKENPQISILGLVQNNRAELSLDLCGPIHKRGYRKFASPGALNESLAAAILRIAQYSGEETFLDPMAGSGTIGIEAALIASKIVPGLLWRQGRGFFSTDFISEKEKREIVKEAKDKISIPKGKIILSDISAENIKICSQNARMAKIDKYITFMVSDFFDLKLDYNEGVIVTNTPYGDHAEIEQEEKEFFKKIGDKLKKDFCGFKAYLLLGSTSAAKSVGLSASKKISLYNGRKEVKLCAYELYQGSLKRRERE